MYERERENLGVRERLGAFLLGRERMCLRA